MIASVAHRSLAAVRSRHHGRTRAKEVQEEHSSLSVKLARNVIVGFLGPDSRETAANGVVHAVFHVCTVLHTVFFPVAARRATRFVSAGPLEAWNLIC